MEVFWWGYFFYCLLKFSVHPSYWHRYGCKYFTLYYQISITVVAIEFKKIHMQIWMQIRDRGHYFTLYFQISITVVAIELKKSSLLISNLLCCDMNTQMFCKIPLVLVSFAAFVALELSFLTMCPQMTLQVTRGSRSVGTLVTLVWLFCCVIHHDMSFQIPKVGAGIIAHCATVGLFSRMAPVM